MFKLVVLSVVAALAACEPSALFALPAVAPLAYHSTVIAPATKSISAHSTSIVHPSPIYATYPGYAHFLKKRSAALLVPPTAYTSYPGLGYSSYAYTHAPAYAPISPLVYPSPVPHIPGYSHILKKRSVALAPIAPLTYTNTYANTYSHVAHPFSTLYSSPIYKSPAFYSNPLLHTPLTYY